MMGWIKYSQIKWRDKLYVETKHITIDIKPCRELVILLPNEKQKQILTLQIPREGGRADPQRFFLNNF